MKNLFVAIFVVAALALIFAQAWSMVAKTALSQYAKKNEEGVVVNPLDQTLIYAISVSVAVVAIIGYIHFYTDVDLGAGFKRKHR